GHSHYAIDVDYVYFGGYGHSAAAQSALECWSLMEQNDFLAGGDYAYNSGMYGVFLRMQGQVWMSHLFGEASKMYNDGIFPNITIYCLAVGFNNYAENVEHNLLFGADLKSRRTGYDGLFDGRIVLGEDANFYYNDGSGYSGGYNQDSWFSQNEMITTWPNSWTTSRFEFPIIYSSTWAFEAYIVGTEQNCANIYFWKIEGLIKNTAGTTTLVWSTVTNLYRDVATKEWQVIADDPNDRLVFQFRDTAGPDVTDCNIQFALYTEEVGRS
ncbi:MAG: hypothetical protein ACXABD_22030, partial [Candidatus Thorarchaeota archaeon]